VAEKKSKRMAPMHSMFAIALHGDGGEMKVVKEEWSELQPRGSRPSSLFIFMREKFVCLFPSGLFVFC
jgi:hypothetical protein